MIHKEEWTYNQEWLDYVNETWSGAGRVQLVSDDSKARLSFQARAEKAFLSQGVSLKAVKTWISIQEPEEGEGYAAGFPHVHHPLAATTLVHYLDPGDIPAPLDIFNGETVVETIYPEQGLTVFMPNRVRHGVRKNSGKLNRVQMIATAL